MAATAFLLVAAFYGASGVVLGAFGRHGLKSHLSGALLETWQTAVLYHLIHALALLAVGVWLRLGSAAMPSSGVPERALLVAGSCFALGVLLFSGSLYVMALGGPRLFGPVTPFGGVAFIAGWIALVWAALRA